MTPPTAEGRRAIRWYHWAVYRLFRWVWNPILRRNRGICQGLGNALLYYHDDKIIERAETEFRQPTTPRVAP